MEATEVPATTLPDRQVKVFTPPKNAGPVAEIPESAYKLSSNEIKQLYQSQVERRQNLENKPLETQKMRDVKDNEKLKKYPKTTIRIRMPDHTIVQAVFQSKERVSAIYEFVKSILETPDRKFVLCLPPRTKLVDPTQTLFKAGLSPASNVLFGWIDKATTKCQDLKKEYLDMKQELTTPTSTPSSTPPPPSPSSTQKSSSSTTKKVPAWLQKGLFNKKS